MTDSVLFFFSNLCTIQDDSWSFIEIILPSHLIVKCRISFFVLIVFDLNLNIIRVRSIQGIFYCSYQYTYSTIVRITFLTYVIEIYHENIMLKIVIGTIKMVLYAARPDIIQTEFPLLFKTVALEQNCRISNCEIMYKYVGLIFRLYTVMSQG